MWIYKSAYGQQQTVRASSQSRDDNLTMIMDSLLRGLVFLLLVVGGLTEDLLTKHMDNVIKVVENIEADNPGLEPLDVVIGLRNAAGIDTPFIQNYFGPLSDDSRRTSLILKPELSSLITSGIHHKVTRLGVEEGVVLTNDGFTVALAPLLLGLEAGLRSILPSRVRGLYPLTLTDNLVRSFLHHSQNPSTSSLVGAYGCWNSMKEPQVFTLSGVASLATDALINGGMDGAILGKHLADTKNRPVILSSLLKRYYNHQLDEAGLDAAPKLISQRRRTNFHKLVNLPLLKQQVMRSLATVQKLDKMVKNLTIEKKKMEEIVNQGLDEFIHTYSDCPPIVARCTWEARPYKGTPTQLRFPLRYLFIHHTVSPSKPCLTFADCARDMRSMQRYHQDTNGWADIGYSFVVGGDGNLYEGRGWNWQGAHTVNYNHLGYGVSYIGDFTSTKPSAVSIDLVKNKFTKCATAARRLEYSHYLKGHRQMSSTACPGNALYAEIQGWPNFRP